MKVIFLDIDGVLNTQNDVHEGVHLNPIFIKRINNLVEFGRKSGPVTVCISSAWRVLYDLDEIIKMLRVTGLRAIVNWDKTPIINDPERCRGDEIGLWLKANERKIKGYVIIDDSNDFLDYQKSFHIHTKSTEGFTEAKLEEAITIFSYLDLC